MKKKIYPKKRPLIIPEAYIIEEQAKRKPKKIYIEGIYLPTCNDKNTPKEPANKEDRPEDEGVVIIIKI